MHDVDVTHDPRRSASAVLRVAWVPPVAAIVAGCLAAFVLPFGIGVLIALVFPVSVIAILLGLLISLAVLRFRPGPITEVGWYSVAWMVAIVLVTVLGLIVLDATGILVSREPLVDSIGRELLAGAPLRVALFLVMVAATVAAVRVTRRRAEHVE